MSVREENNPARETDTPVVSPGNYSPVTVDLNGNGLGAIFLGILAVLLLIGWMRTEARYHALITQLISLDHRRLTNSG